MTTCDLRSAEADDRARRREQAIRWFVVLHGAERSARVLKAWKKWEAIPQNREAFDAVERVWGQLDALPSPPLPSPQERVDDRYDGSVPVMSWVTSRTAAATEAFKQRMKVFTLGFAAAIMVVAVGLYCMVQFGHLTGWTDRQQMTAETSIGEHKTLLLSDGSRIHLGAQTLVSTRFTRHGRRLVLHRGEALFEVAPDPKRPFHVNAGQSDITAVGTAFRVLRRSDDQVKVAVIHGIVDVSPNSPTPAASNAVRRLTRGQEVSLDSDGRLSEVRVTEMSAADEWRDGRLTYRGERLRDVIQDINRYSSRQIIIADVAAGDLLFSGIVFERRLGAWIAGLEKIYPEIEIATTDDERILIRTRDAVADQR